MTATNDLKRAFAKIKGVTKSAIEPTKRKLVAKEAIRLIRVRTRLGYGVKAPGGQGSRYRLSTVRWSDRYALFRKSYPELSQFTRPTKHNLTLTGQMLDSLAILSQSSNETVIGPQGSRFDSDRTNDQIAQYQADAGRVFMNLSKNENNQLLRFYRQTFTSLLKRVGLLR
jgi:hypothetical protein